MVVKKKSVKRSAVRNAMISSADQVARTKYWSEINQTEKIERVRALVKSTLSTLERLAREIETLKDITWDHAHEQDGSVAVKIKKERRHKLEKGGMSEVRIKHFPSAENKNQDDVYI